MNDSKSPSIWLGYSFMLLGLFLMALDITVTDVAVPAIVKDLNISADVATLIVTIYLVVTAALLIPLGKVADLKGARKSFIQGTFGFAIGVGVC